MSSISLPNTAGHGGTSDYKRENEEEKDPFFTLPEHHAEIEKAMLRFCGGSTYRKGYTQLGIPRKVAKDKRKRRY